MYMERICSYYLGRLPLANTVVDIWRQLHFILKTKTRSKHHLPQLTSEKIPSEYKFTQMVSNGTRIHIHICMFPKLTLLTLCFIINTINKSWLMKRNAMSTCVNTHPPPHTHTRFPRFQRMRNIVLEWRLITVLNSYLGHLGGSVG